MAINPIIKLINKTIVKLDLKTYAGLTLIVIACINLSKSYTFQLDDALIYARYVRNALDGNGLVYNPGERVNALTSPLYSYTLIAISYILQNIQAATIVLYLVYLSVAVAIITTLISSRIGPFFAALGAFFIISSQYFYSVIGMESPLLVMLISLSIFLYDRKQYNLLSIVATLLVLTRVESGALILVLILDWLLFRRDKIDWLQCLWPPILLLSIHYGFNFIYYGHILPDSATAKLAQGHSGLWGDDLAFVHPHYLSNLVFGDGDYLTKAWLAMAIIGIISLGFCLLNRVIIPFIGIYVAFYSILGIPGYHWYYAPIVFFFYIYTASGLWAVYSTCSSLFEKIQPFTLVWATSIIALLGLILLKWSHPPSGPTTPAYRDIGIWLSKNTPANAKIAAAEIGILGYYSDRYIIDILGLVSPHNAEHLATRSYDAWLYEYKPDYILMHDPAWSFELGVKMFYYGKPRYFDERFVYPGYKLICAGTFLDGCVEGRSARLASDREAVFISTDEITSELKDGGGYIDKVSMYNGNQGIYVSGWINFPDTAVNKKLFILNIPKPKSYQLHSSSRNDVADSMNNQELRESGFDLFIDYLDEDSAKRACNAIALASGYGSEPKRKLIYNKKTCD